MQGFFNLFCRLAWSGIGLFTIKLAHVRSLAYVFIVFASVLWIGKALAQSPSELEASRQADLIQRQNQQRIQEDVNRAKDQVQPSIGADTEIFVPPSDSGLAPMPCRNNREIVVDGAPNLSPNVSSDIKQNFAGRCLGVVEIEQILALITRDYITRGYITTRAYVPSQDLSTGILKILVLEGRLENIILEDGDKTSIRLSNAFPANSGDLLNLRDIEQGLEQINRLQSNNATMDIQPGSSPGASVLVVRNEPSRPYRGSINFDNQGSESTGKDQWGVTLSADGLLRLNDFIVLTHRQSYPANRHTRYSESSSLFLSVPAGYSTVTFSHSQSQYASSVVGDDQVFRLTGESTTDTLRIDRVVYRDQARRLSINGGLTLKESRNYFEDTFLSLNSRRLTVFDVGMSGSMALFGGFFILDLGLSQGLDFAGALKDASDLPNSAARAQFTTFKYGYNYRAPLKIAGAEWIFSSQLIGQYAADVLYGSEQISIGGIYSVRGFVRNSLAGDHGYYVRNELALNQKLPIAGQSLSTRWFVGIDQGEVHNRAVGAGTNGKLVGMAYGVSLQFKGGQVELFGSRPLSLPNHFTKDSPQFFARLSYTL